MLKIIGDDMRINLSENTKYANIIEKNTLLGKKSKTINNQDIFDKKKHDIKFVEIDEYVQFIFIQFA